MEEERGKKRPLDLNWNKLLDSGDDPLEVVIVPEKPKASAPVGGETRKKGGMGGGGDEQPDNFIQSMTDCALDDKIKRQQQDVEKLAKRLPDGGEKLRAYLKRLEAEKERRKLRRVDTDTGKGEQLTQAMSSRNIGASTGFREEASFSSIFAKKMEENSDSRTTSEFQRESSLLRCNRQNMKSNGDLLQKGGKKGRTSSRSLPRRLCPSNFYHKRDNSSLSNGDYGGRASSPYSLRHVGGNSSSRAENNASQVNGSRPRQAPTIVLVDEEEPVDVEEPVDEEEPEPRDTTEQVEEFPDCMKDAKIYYPSRNDPKAVEICYADIKCLDPGGFLTSTIMNFYIRYLQQQASPTDRETCDCHFFNTFFYEKLKEAVAYKGNDKDKLFAKFRRWWKGINIFQKAYVLIPINEDVHWSLVIICIPDKEEESGPIVLHLDSLGIHSPRSVFQNIKSYLKEEWYYLDQEIALSDLPIADTTWKQLPQSIEEKKLAVPQQRNEYDCGLFVLFFMERFIEEAPQRLKKKDLQMFGKRWFKPEEASSLRMKIRKLLGQEFRNACEVNCAKESSPSVDTSEE